MADQARDRLLAELRKQGGTTALLARRAGCDPGYAREILYGLMQAGQARRQRRPDIRAFWWEAV